MPARPEHLSPLHERARQTRRECWKALELRIPVNGICAKAVTLTGTQTAQQIRVSQQIRVCCAIRWFAFHSGFRSLPFAGSGHRKTIGQTGCGLAPKAPRLPPSANWRCTGRDPIPAAGCLGPRRSPKLLLWSAGQPHRSDPAARRRHH